LREHSSRDQIFGAGDHAVAVRVGEVAVVGCARIFDQTRQPVGHRAIRGRWRAEKAAGDERAVLVLPADGVAVGVEHGVVVQEVYAGHPLLVTGSISVDEPRQAHEGVVEIARPVSQRSNRGDDLARAELGAAAALVCLLVCLLVFFVALVSGLLAAAAVGARREHLHG